LLHLNVIKAVIVLKSQFRFWVGEGATYVRQTTHCT